MSDHAGLLVAAAHMREHHGPGHQRHEMWAAIAAWLEHDAEACGLNRSPFVDETHDLAHQVALTYLTDRATPEKDAGLTRDPADMADACLATWLTPSELQMRHERGDHEHCPPTWCQVAAIYQQADDQCRRARESSVFPPGSDGGVS